MNKLVFKLLFFFLVLAVTPLSYGNICDLSALEKSSQELWDDCLAKADGEYGDKEILYHMAIVDYKKHGKVEFEKHGLDYLNQAADADHVLSLALKAAYLYSKYGRTHAKASREVSRRLSRIVLLGRDYGDIEALLISALANSSLTVIVKEDGTKKIPQFDDWINNIDNQYIEAGKWCSYMYFSWDKEWNYNKMAVNSLCKVVKNEGKGVKEAKQYIFDITGGDFTEVCD